jgi:hypothetical protein
MKLLNRPLRLIAASSAGLAVFAATNLPDYICINTGNSSAWDTCSVRSYSNCTSVYCEIIEIPLNSDICSPLPGWVCRAQTVVRRTVYNGTCAWVSGRCQCITAGLPYQTWVPTC